MEVRWTRRARTRLDQIGAYIALANPVVAGQVVSRIFDLVEHLAEHPSLGRTGRIEGTRELIVPDYPYLVAYRVVADEVHVLTIIHASRRWPRDL